MRSILEFDVYGESYEDIILEAAKYYQEYVGRPEASLPPSTTIEAEPANELVSDGGSTILYWKAHVHISTSR